MDSLHWSWFWASRMRIRIRHYFYGYGSFHYHIKQKKYENFYFYCLVTLWLYRYRYWCKCTVYLQKVIYKKSWNQWRKVRGTNPRIRIRTYGTRMPRIQSTAYTGRRFQTIRIRIQGPHWIRIRIRSTRWNKLKLPWHRRRLWRIPCQAVRW